MSDLLMSHEGERYPQESYEPPPEPYRFVRWIKRLLHLK